MRFLSLFSIWKPCWRGPGARRRSAPVTSSDPPVEDVVTQASPIRVSLSPATVTAPFNDMTDPIPEERESTGKLQPANCWPLEKEMLRRSKALAIEHGGRSGTKPPTHSRDTVVKVPSQQRSNQPRERPLLSQAHAERHPESGKEDSASDGSLSSRRPLLKHKR